MEAVVFSELMDYVREVKVLKGILDGIIDVKASCQDKNVEKKVTLGLSDGTFYRYALAKVMAIMNYLAMETELKKSDVILINKVMIELNKSGVRLLFDGIFAGDFAVRASKVNISYDEVYEVIGKVVDNVADRYDAVIHMSNMMKKLQTIEFNFVIAMKVVNGLSKGTFDNRGSSFFKACDKAVELWTHSSLLLSNSLNDDIGKVRGTGIRHIDILMANAVVSQMRTVNGCFASMKSNDINFYKNRYIFIAESMIIDKISIPFDVIERTVRDVAGNIK